MPVLTTALWLMVAAYCGFVAWKLVEGHQAAARGETPLYTDFTSTYAGALLLRSQPTENLYRPRQLFVAELEAASAAYGGRINEEQIRAVGYSPWMYPPTFLLFVVLLAYLPYLAAYLGWIALTAMPYLAAMTRIFPPSCAVPAALAAPPVFFNLMYGQTAFLSTGLIALGLLSLRTQPWLAGVLIGVASVKPHLGILIPFALAAGGHWRAFGGASATVVGLIAISIAAFGMDPWYGFIGTIDFHLQGYEAGVFAWKVMTTVLSALKLSGVALSDAWVVQHLVTLCTGVLVAVAWWRHRAEEHLDGLRYALLCCGTLLALPFAYVYELVLLVPAVAWFWRDWEARGGKRWEIYLAVAALTTPLPIRLLTPVAGVGLVLVGELLLFGLIWRRLSHQNTALPTAG